MKNNSKIYGYCRISTAQQNIQRQERNILKAYPEARIIHEVFTGTKFQGRKELDKLLKQVKAGDTIVFDEVSRMARNADEGTVLYFDLYNKGINLVFLKERHIDTASYNEALKASGIDVKNDGSVEGELLNDIVNAINKFMKAKATADIHKAFEQAQKEVEYLHTRTKEGIETARQAGKQIGQKAGNKLTVKKAISAKATILKHNVTFGGTLSDSETMTQTGISRNTFYKYKRELAQEIEESDFDTVKSAYTK